MQGHMVYNDSGEGYENYGIFVWGDNQYSNCKTTVKVFVTVLYEEEVLVIPTGEVLKRTYWGPSPIDLVIWDGDMGYGASAPIRWNYTAGVSYSTYVGGYWTPDAYYDDYPQINPPVKGSFRYFGYFDSNYNGGGHSLKACVRLHVMNDVASEWGSGAIYYVPEVCFVTTRILSIRIKVVFEFETYWGIKSHTHIMGDGVNPDGNDIDLNKIPFVVGSCK
jgi:hypothetical protein